MLSHPGGDYPFMDTLLVVTDIGFQIYGMETTGVFKKQAHVESRVRCDFGEIEKVGLNSISESVHSLTHVFRSQKLTLLPYDGEGAEWRSIMSIASALVEEVAVPDPAEEFREPGGQNRFSDPGVGARNEEHFCHQRDIKAQNPAAGHLPLRRPAGGPWAGRDRETVRRFAKNPRR